jgi:Ca2+-binding EF-hand superfamily protein
MDLSDDHVYALAKKYSLTEDDVQDCADVFKLLSQGHIGIPNREIKGALQLLKQNPRDAAVDELLEEIGSNGSIAEFENFLYIFRSVKEETSEAELLDSFKIFDRKGDGFIDAEDFLQNLTTLGEPLTERQAQQIVDEVTQADGRIRYADLLAAMRKWH